VFKMQFLIEEVFSKIFKFIDGINLIFLKWLIKIIFIIAVGIVFVFLGVLVYRKEYVWVLVLLGLLFFGEVAHYLRKSREKVMQKRISNRKRVDAPVKNSHLLSKNKPKNNSLLDDDSGVVKKVKGNVVKKKRIVKSVNKKIVKNKNLLKISKPKNNGLLDKK